MILTLVSQAILYLYIYNTNLQLLFNMNYYFSFTVISTEIKVYKYTAYD